MSTRQDVSDTISLTIRDGLQTTWREYLRVTDSIISALSGGAIKPRTAEEIAAVTLGCLLLLLLIYARTLLLWVKRLWFGHWIYNEDMRQYLKVMGRDQHGHVLEAKDHVERRAEAVRARRERYGLFAAYMGMVIVTYFVFKQSKETGASFWLIPLFFCLAAWAFFLTFYVIADLITELLYIAGFQHMKGARVIMPRAAVAPGPEALQCADGYGRAAPAKSADISALYTGKRSSEAQTRFRR